MSWDYRANFSSFLEEQQQIYGYSRTLPRHCCYLLSQLLLRVL
jgi:hypothetical protein